MDFRFSANPGQTTDNRQSMERNRFVPIKLLGLWKRTLKRKDYSLKIGNGLFVVTHFIFLVDMFFAVCDD